MARASTPTLLSIDRWFKMLNLNPVHAGGAYGSLKWPLKGTCEQLWPQHAWQNLEVVSREAVAEAINDAEEDLMRVVGYPLAPRFFSMEPHSYSKGVKTKYGKLISPGRRGLSIILKDAGVTYSDADGDGWKELATITASTSLTDAREIKLYFANKNGDPAWEIRPLKEVTFSGGTVTIKVDSWLFIKPNLWEEYPDYDDFTGVDVTDTNNYVGNIDVYREYVDSTVSSVTFWWANTTGCSEALGITEQTGMFVITDVLDGRLIALPANYENGAWNGTTWTNCGCEPTGIKLWYYAGDQADSYLSGLRLDPLSDYWAQAIVWLSVARLEFDVCDCGPAKMLFAEYRKDITQSKKGESFSMFQDPETVGNPWGTRLGAIWAWNRARKVAGELAIGGGVL